MINSFNDERNVNEHENEQFVRDIQIFDSKNIDFDEWITQIEKVALLTSNPEYTLAEKTKTQRVFTRLHCILDGNAPLQYENGSRYDK